MSKNKNVSFLRSFSKFLNQTFSNLYHWINMKTNANRKTGPVSEHLWVAIEWQTIHFWHLLQFYFDHQAATKRWKIWLDYHLWKEMGHFSFLPIIHIKRRFMIINFAGNSRKIRIRHTENILVQHLSTLQRDEIMSPLCNAILEWLSKHFAIHLD